MENQKEILANAEKRVELVQQLKKRIMTFGHVDDPKIAEEIARKWIEN